MNTINDTQCNNEPTEEIMVACDICLKEVPASEVKNCEATDYVRHFCGLECYEKWRMNLQIRAVKILDSAHPQTSRRFPGLDHGIYIRSLRGTGSRISAFPASQIITGFQ